MTMKDIKAYMIGNERVGWTVKARMHSKTLFESHFEEKVKAERFLNQLEGVRIVKAESYQLS